MRLVSLVTLMMFTATSVSTTETETLESGTVVKETAVQQVPFFASVTFSDALLYGAVFAFFVAGCVFWAGAQGLAKRG